MQYGLLSGACEMLSLPMFSLHLCNSKLSDMIWVYLSDYNFINLLTPYGVTLARSQNKEPQCSLC